MAQLNAEIAHMQEKEEHGGDNTRRAPEHHHEGFAAFPSGPSTAAATLAVGRLDDDVLGNVFKFLSLHELAIVMRITKRWRAVVCGKMGSADLALRLRERMLPSVAQSPLVRHIRGLEHVHGISGMELLALAQPHWRNLRVLNATLDADAAQTAVFPLTLHQMTLQFPRDVTPEQVARVVAAVCHLPVLETLALHARNYAIQSCCRCLQCRFSSAICCRGQQCRIISAIRCAYRSCSRRSCAS